MAFKEAGEWSGGGDRFLKWEKVGQSVTGEVVAVVPKNRFDKPEIELTVGGEGKIIGLATDLAARFKAAFGSLDRIPLGVRVRIGYIGTKDVGQPKPMKVFRLEVDTDTLPSGFALDPAPDTDDEIGY